MPVIFDLKMSVKDEILEQIDMFFTVTETVNREEIELEEKIVKIHENSSSEIDEGFLSNIIEKA